MTAKDFYRAIGQIDDSLIVAANERPVRKYRLITGFAAAAACVLLVGFGALRYFFGTTIVWNEISGVPSSKISAPADSTLHEMTRDEAEDYYALGAFPDVIGDALQYTGPDEFVIYLDAAGNIVRDDAQLWYTRLDGTASVTLTLARVSGVQTPAAEGKLSRINGREVWLCAVDAEGGTVYTAQWKQNDTSVSVSADGLSKKDFLALIEVLLALKFE